MAAVYARAGTRCQEHPHRRTDDRCDHCAQPFCDECLISDEPLWFCARCLGALREAEVRAALERSLAFRAARAARRTRIVLTALSVAAVALVVGTAATFVVARRFGAAAPDQSIDERGAACGELSRIRSVGAVGVPAPEEVVNTLAYPHRAAVRVVRGGAGAAAGGGAEGHAGLEALVDECDAGWRTGTGAALPLTLELEVRVEGTISVQRIALWQDPSAPRASWIRDFELLASQTVDGEDFVPLTLDRERTLAPTTEQQWFGVVQPQPMGLTLDRLARGGAQATGTDAPPDVAHVRRLRLRVLSTHGMAGEAGAPESAARDGVSLGEIAAYGPDQELRVGVVCSAGPASVTSCVYGFVPAQLRALAGRPRVVYFVNDTDSAHTFTTLGQDVNADVRVGPGQSASIRFTAAGRAGVYEYYCKILDHASQGMRGGLVVR